jgi:hypothetical protein
MHIILSLVVLMLEDLTVKKRMESEDRLGGSERPPEIDRT